MRLFDVRIRPLVLLPLALFALAACTDEEIVYRDRPPFNPPVDSVNGFLGLYNVDTKQTNCGNCHVSTQSQWATHGHADAYEGLVDNVPNPPATCFGCHTVSEKGNIFGATGQPGGWNVVQDASYRGVQCESCHGPGLTHASNPEVSANWPLAHVDVPAEAELESPEIAVTCAACHSDAHHPFAEQWRISGHANEELAADEGGNTTCRGCHEGRAALYRFGGGESNTNFVEKTGTKMLSITCSVCHDPHGNTDNAAQLRLSMSAENTQENLCGSCHLRVGRDRPTPSFSNTTATTLRRGPHASQASVYFGMGAGWIPAGFVYDSGRSASSHASSALNPTLCGGCHVKAFEVNDPATGEFVINAVGHTFQSIPCVDAQGVPTGANDCAYDDPSRNFTACSASGCHASEPQSVTLFNNIRNEMQGYLNVLWLDDGVLGAQGDSQEPYLSPATDGGLLASVLRQNLDDPVCKKTVNGVQVAAKAFDATDNCLSVAEGALWNALLFSKNLYAQNDGSFGVHNPFYYRGILISTIEAVRTAYPTATTPIPATVQAAIEAGLNDPRTGFVRVRQTAAR